MQELAGDDYVERNYHKKPLTQREIVALVDAVGSVDALLNTRHAVAKQNRWKDKTPSKSAFAKAASTEPNLLKRPVIVSGARGVVSRGCGNDPGIPHLAPPDSCNAPGAWIQFRAGNKGARRKATE